MPPRGLPNPAMNQMDDMATQFGLMNALRTGNMVVDMCICMALPLFFGGIANVMNRVMPGLQIFGEARE